MSGHPCFYELPDEMRTIHDEKNADYSKDEDPLSNFRIIENIGIPAWIGIVVRLSDKLSRIMQLTRKALEGREAAVKDETVKDTLIDLANYRRPLHNTVRGMGEGRKSDRTLKEVGDCDKDDHRDEQDARFDRDSEIVWHT
jgi:hypothetical protein